MPNPEAPVAVCTLASATLPAQLADRGLDDRTMLIAPLEMENVGIERIITYALDHPALRFVILAGPDLPGRRAAQALLALHENGLAENGTIAGARSAHAILSNVTPEEVAAFRDQVELIDLRESENVDRIAQTVEECWARNPGPITTPRAPRVVEPVEATHDKYREWDMDPLGYWLIIPKPDEGIIVCEQYDYQYKLQQVIRGTSAETICATITRLNLVSRMQHAAYLGRETAKAETALKHGLKYVQDDPL